MMSRARQSKRDAGKNGGTRRRRRKPPGDLIEFYRRWQEFRGVAVAVSRRADLSAEQRDTVNWLILLVDRIGEHDVGPLAGK